MADASDAPTPNSAAGDAYFVRLLARHTALPGPIGRRARPRLPGPFERAGALPAEPAAPAGEPAPGPGVGSGGTEAVAWVVREEPAVRSPYVTVAGPPAPGHRPAPPGAPVSGARNPGRDRDAPLRPAPSAAPAVPGRRAARTAAPESRTAPGPPAAPQPGAAPATAAGALLPPTVARASPVSSGPVGRRDAVRAEAARRAGARTAEPSVRVEIGRVEVTAAAPPAPERSRAARGPRGRREPAVSLADFLGHDGARDGERRSQP